MRGKKKKHLSQFMLLFLFLNAFVYAFIAIKIFFPKQNSAAGKVAYTDASYHQAALKIYDKCKSLNYREMCYADQFKQLTQKTNLVFARSTLNATQDIDPTNTLGCHLIAHYISIAETEKNPANWKDVLKEVDSNSCTGGFVHGVLEAHMNSDPSYKISAQEIPKICSLVPDETKGGDLNCSHNLGHILLAQEWGNIPKAVDICNGVSGSGVRYECLSGIFMENETRLNLQAHGVEQLIPWDQKTTNNQENICLNYTGQIAVSCWREISHMFAQIENNIPEKVFEDCNKAPDQTAAKACYMHGTSIMVVSSNFDMKNLNKVCEVYSEGNPNYDLCISNVMGGMLLSSEKYSGTVIKLCSGTADGYQESCFTKMGKMLYGVERSAEKRIALCESAPKQYQTECSQTNSQGS